MRMQITTEIVIYKRKRKIVKTPEKRNCFLTITPVDQLKYLNLTVLVKMNVKIL